MDILKIIMDGIKGAERRFTVKNRNDPHWKRQKAKMIMAASHASLEMGIQRLRDSRDYDDYSEDEFDDEPYSEGDLEATLEKILGRPPRSKSRESVDHNNRLQGSSRSRSAGQAVFLRSAIPAYAGLASAVSCADSNSCRAG